MIRRSAGPALCSALLGTLAACAPTPVDSALVTQWRADRQNEIDADGSLIAALSSTAAAGEAGDRIEAELATPGIPTAVTFDCYGEGSLHLTIESSARTGTAATTTTAVLGAFDCADSPHDIAPTSLGEEAVASVSATASDADRDTAWTLTVSGGTTTS